jgi:hypothetical protein
MVRPSSAPRLHLVEAASQLLAAGGRAELLALVADVLPMRVLVPLQVVLADHAPMDCYDCASSKPLPTQYSSSLGYLAIFRVMGGP